MQSEAVQILPDSCVDAHTLTYEEFVYITEKRDAGIVCCASIIWNFDLIVACALWSIPEEHSDVAVHSCWEAQQLTLYRSSMQV